MDPGRGFRVVGMGDVFAICLQIPGYGRILQKAGCRINIKGQEPHLPTVKRKEQNLFIGTSSRRLYLITKKADIFLQAPFK
jgi:hypothetical protein